MVLFLIIELKKECFDNINLILFFKFFVNLMRKNFCDLESEIFYDFFFLIRFFDLIEF